MPDNPMLLQFVATSAAIVGVMILLAILLGNFLHGYLSGILLSFGILLAGIVGLFLRVGLSYPLERDWHIVPWLAGITAILSSVWPFRGFANPIPAALSTVIVYFGLRSIFPSGDELFEPSRPYWLVIVLSSTFLNVYLLRMLAMQNGSRWFCWILVGQLLALSGLVMMVYAELSAAVLGYAVIAGLLAIASIPRVKGDPLNSPDTRGYESITDAASDKYEGNIAQSHHMRPSMTYPWILTAVAPLCVVGVLMATCFRNYNYLSLPLWGYALLMFLPSIAAGIDLIALRSKRTWLRVVAAALITASIASVPIIQMSLTPAEETW